MQAQVNQKMQTPALVKKHCGLWLCDPEVFKTEIDGATNDDFGFVWNETMGGFFRFV